MVPVPTVEPLTAENMLWANTVLAAGSAIGFVVYTGAETRAVMNTSHPKTKVGLLDLEINRLAKVRLFLGHRIHEPKADCSCRADFVCGYVCYVARARRSQWLPWSLVCVRLQVPDPVFFHHPNKVSVKYSPA